MHESFRDRFRDQAAIEPSELLKREDWTLMEVTNAEGERRRGVRFRGVGSAKIHKVQEHHFGTPQIRLAKSCSPNGDRTRISALRGPRPKPLDDRARVLSNWIILELCNWCGCNSLTYRRDPKMGNWKESGDHFSNYPIPQFHNPTIPSLPR